jgi:hypothetical protein
MHHSPCTIAWTLLVLQPLAKHVFAVMRPSWYANRKIKLWNKWHFVENKTQSIKHFLNIYYFPCCLLPDKCEWQNGFKPNTKWGMVWKWMGPRPINALVLGCINGVQKGGIASALSSTTRYSWLKYTVKKKNHNAPYSYKYKSSPFVTLLTQLHSKILIIWSMIFYNNPQLLVFLTFIDLSLNPDIASDSHNNFRF